MSWLKPSLLVAVLVSAWLAGRAHARFGERAIAFGEALASVSPAVGRETAMVLNGQPIRLASLSSEDAPAAVLARAQRELSGAFALRSAAGEGAGAVLALDVLDAHTFGLRYVFARASASGGSHVIVAWTEGRLELGALFPASGDAAGSDLDGLPRPRAALRLLSAGVPNRGYALAAYRVAGEPEVALERYATELRSGGARVVRLAAQRGSAVVEVEHQRALVHGFRQGDHSVIALVRAGDVAARQEGDRVE